jgi:hypothetical protein
MLSAYDEQRKLEWQRLMGLDPPAASARTEPWARRHFQELVSSLPASADDLDDLFAQLGITLS